jgi:predicted enzyme related to lactoylglutathione lyase
MTAPDQSPGRIVGIGGIFFRSTDHEGLRSWYQNKLGILSGDYGGIFKWRDHANPETENYTVWSIFPSSTAYFNPSESTFMINYIVDNLDAFLAKCAAHGVQIDDKRETHAYGRFAWIYDPDGNKIELWQPVGGIPANRN